MKKSELKEKSTISNKYGVAGFVFALIGFFIPILIFSIVAIILSSIQLKRNKTGLAVAGLVIGILVVLISFVVIPLLIWSILVPVVRVTPASPCIYAEKQIQLRDIDQKPCVNENDQLVFEVSRGDSLGFDLVDIMIIVSYEGSGSQYYFIEYNTQIYEASGELVKNKNQLPNQGETKSYYIEGIQNADEISLAPIVLSRDGKMECDVSSTRIIREC